MGIQRHLLLASIVSILSFSDQASASIIQVNSRAALGTVQTIDWNAFGPPGALVSTPFTVAAASELVTVSSSQGTLSRHREGTDFVGNFAVGDQLLTDTGSSSDTFGIRWTSPVRSVGTQIQRDFPRTGTFTAYMDFFSATNVLLGEVSVTGNGTSAEDNTAIFIGGVSTSFDIARVALWIDNAPDAFPARSGNLAINRMDIGVLVPAPGAAALLIPLLALLGVRRRS